MIALLTGKIIKKEANHCIIDVNGVGYQASISLTTLSQLGEIGNTVTLFIYTYVREDQLTLYGFANEAEKQAFLQLITISGVGPRMALSILSGIPAEDLGFAIGNEDLARLTAIPGVGKKTAERIIVELKDKLIKTFPMAGITSGTSGNTSTYHEVCSALVNLGYPQPAAEGAVRKLKSMDNLPLADAIKLALKELVQ